MMKYYHLEGDNNMLGLLAAGLAAAASFVSSAVSVIGSTVATTAVSIMTKLPIIVEKALPVVRAIGTIVNAVSSIVGILAPENENMEELGAKAMQDGTRPRRPDETAQEYLDYLRNEVELNEEKYKDMTDDERLGCATVGIALRTEEMSDYVGVQVSPDFLAMAQRTKMQYEQISKVIEVFKNSGEKTLDDVPRYLDNTLNETRAEKVGNLLKESIKETNPEFGDKEIYDEIIEMKRNYNSPDEYIPS